jgi:DNA-binding response OmpR family regulator
VVTLDSPDGLQAAIDREAPDMVLMDVQMGDQDGIVMTRTLRALPRNRDLPILLFSGSMGMATREAGFRAGADDFFAKPIVPQELRQRLHLRLERRRLRRVAEGMHGALDVTLAPRTARDAAAAWTHRDAHTLVVIHPDPGFDDAAWLAEVRRIAAALAGVAGALGFHDGDALLAVLSPETPAAIKQLETLRAGRPASAPLWHAGAVAKGDAGPSVDRARRSALEALDVSRRTSGSGVHQWTRDDDAVAPDVIVVEDDTSLSDMLEYALRAGGYTYRTFPDGNAAYAALIEMRAGGRRPIVLLDIDLPGMDGHSLHERLRAERPGAFIVVFLSVHSAEGDQVRALHAGAWDYMTKPLNVRVLMAKLPVWLARAAIDN